MFDLYKKNIMNDVTTYVRPYQTISQGPLSGQNSMVIAEEQITVLPDLSCLHTPLGELHATITDPTQVFNIVNPVDGTVTGTMTFAQLKVQMYSLYLYLASVRDQAP